MGSFGVRGLEHISWRDTTPWSSGILAYLS